MLEYKQQDNSKPNGKECVECKNPLTGSAQKYCSGVCSRKAGDKRRLLKYKANKKYAKSDRS